MPSRVRNPSKGNTYPTIFTIGEGGTGATTAAQALANLGGIPATDIDKPGGPIRLNAQAKIDITYFSSVSLVETGIDGPKTVPCGSTTIFHMTTFDSFNNYVLEPIGGSVSIQVTGSIERKLGKILYTAPTTPGACGFIVDGRIVNLTAVDYVVRTPTVSTPTLPSAGAANFTSSTFSTSKAGEAHVSSDWEVSLYSDFRDVIRSSYSSLNKTSWSVSGLTGNTDHYVRVRYHGSTNHSNWSVGLKFRPTA